MWVSIKNLFIALQSFLGRLFDSSDPTASAKLAGYVLCVIASTVWLTVSLTRNEFKMSAEWILAFQSYLALNAAAVGIEALSNKRNKEKE